MIRFALIAASVLGFALTAALGNLMVPLLRELQRTMHGAQPEQETDRKEPEEPVPTIGGLCLMVGTLAAVGAGWLAACAAQPSLLGSDRQMMSRLLIALLGTFAFGAVGVADDLACIRSRSALGMRRAPRLALEAAAFLGALEAAAFTETNLDRLFDQNERFLTSDFLKALVWDVRNICAKTSYWRVVRAFLDERYGYAKFGGGCHIVPNHALTLASILLGKDSFARSLMIAVSAGWDTDCNAGNVGCFNGIRLGLDALTSEVDFRTPVADRLFVVTADGGEAISDAVRETRKIVRAAALTTGETITLPKQRFAFEHRGSVQGF